MDSRISSPSRITAKPNNVLMCVSNCGLPASTLPVTQTIGCVGRANWRLACSRDFMNVVGQPNSSDPITYEKGSLALSSGLN